MKTFLLIIFLSGAALAKGNEYYFLSCSLKNADTGVMIQEKGAGLGFHVSVDNIKFETTEVEATVLISQHDNQDSYLAEISMTMNESKNPENSTGTYVKTIDPWKVTEEGLLVNRLDLITSSANKYELSCTQFLEFIRD